MATYTGLQFFSWTRCRNNCAQHDPHEAAWSAERQAWRKDPGQKNFTDS